MRVPIAYAINERYTKILMALLIPLFEQADADTIYDLYILNYQLKQESRDAITGIVAKLNKQSLVTFLDISDEEYSLLKECDAGWGIEANYRGFLSKFLPNIDSIVYLDADTMVVADLSHLMGISLDGYLLAGSQDVIKQNHNLLKLAQADNCFLSGKIIANFNYINSGVLLINLAYWREFGIDAEYLRLLRLGTEPAYRKAGGRHSGFSDQDVLNYLAIRDGVDRIYYLPVTYNNAFCYPSIASVEESDVSRFLGSVQTFEEFSVQYEVFRRNQLVFDESLIKDRIQIIHFCSSPKPWDATRDPFDAHVKLFTRYTEQVEFVMPPLRRMTPLQKRIRKVTNSLKPQNFFVQHKKYKLLASIMLLFGVGVGFLFGKML